MDHGAESYRKFLNGDDDGIVEIIRDYKDGLILFLNRYVANIHTAEDLAEDTFFRLVTKKPRFSETASFKTWLYTIGRNTAVSHLRHSGRICEQPVEELAIRTADEEALERSYIREEEKILLHKTLSNLNADYSAVLYLKYFEDLSHEQISSVLKKNKRQVTNLLYQAKQALKAELDKEGFHHEEL